MKKWIVIQSLKSEMEEPTREGWGGGVGGLSYIVCPLSDSAHTKIYAMCSKAEMASGYDFDLHLNLTLCACACMREGAKGYAPE